jgi:hypothetical protein
VCPGDAIATVSGIVMSLRADDGSDSHNILADVIQDPSRFDCGGSSLTAEKLLVEEGTARLASAKAHSESCFPPASRGLENEEPRRDLCSIPSIW